jgi:hypothetical protein
MTDRPERKPWPIKRDGYYWIESEEMRKALGRDRFVAVTEILVVIGKGGMAWAAAKLAGTLIMADPYAYQTPEQLASAVFAEWRKKTGLGKAIHSLVEALAKGGDVQAVELHAGYAAAARAFFAHNLPKARQIEVNLYNSKMGYAGTSDFLGTYGSDETLFLTDYKTSPRVYDEARLQLAAYRACDFMLAEGKLLPLPRVDATAVILLGEDGTYSFNIVDAPLEGFLAAKDLYENLRAMRGE